MHALVTIAVVSAIVGYVALPWEQPGSIRVGILNGVGGLILIGFGLYHYAAPDPGWVLAVVYGSASIVLAVVVLMWPRLQLWIEHCQWPILKIVQDFVSQIGQGDKS
jgi:hypothetical protein